MDEVDFMIITGIIVLGGGLISDLFYRLGAYTQKKKISLSGILTHLKGSVLPNEIPIDTEGEAKDDMLSTTVIANKLVTNVGERISILVFTSVIWKRHPETIEQILDLLRNASLLNMSIDWINDSVPNRHADEIISLLIKLGVRCDSLLDKSEISVNELKDYDVVFHPSAGMKASYETVAKVIRLLSDDSTILV